MPQFLHLPPLAAAIVTITGVVLAVVRLLTASKAFWWRFPEWLQKGLPAALVALGTLPTALESAKSWMDVAVAFVFAVGAWFTASRGDQRPVEPKAPAVPPLGVLTLMVLLLAGCARLATVNWPQQLGDCAAPLEPGLVKAVGAVLAGTGDVESGLAGLVSSGAAADAIECAVAQLVGDIGLRPAEAQASRQAERGRAFLAKVHNRVHQ